MSDSGNSCCNRATATLSDRYDVYEFVGSDEGNESWSSTLERGYQDSGDEGEDGGNEQPAAHGIAEAVDVLVPSPSQGDGVNVQTMLGQIYTILQKTSAKKMKMHQRRPNISHHPMKPLQISYHRLQDNQQEGERR